MRVVRGPTQLPFFRKAGVVHAGRVAGNCVRLLCDPFSLSLRSSVLYTEDPVDCMNCLVEETRRS